MLVLSQVIDYDDGGVDDDAAGCVDDAAGGVDDHDHDEDESGDDDGGCYDVDRDDDDDSYLYDCDDCFCYEEVHTEIHLDFYNILKLPSCSLKMPPSFNN